MKTPIVWMLTAVIVLLSPPLHAELNIKEARNFVILVDISGSMGERFQDTEKTKLVVAKEILHIFNDNLTNQNYTASLITFSPFTEYYPLGGYDKELFRKAIEALPETYFAGGVFGPPTPLDRVMQKLDKLLKDTAGLTIVYLFSDGRHTGEADPIAQARVVAAHHEVCFFVFSLAETPDEQRTLSNLIALNECSQLVDFDYAAKRPEVTELPIGKIVTVRFEMDSASGKQEMFQKLDELATILQNTPGMTAVISGHACNIGSAEYNQKLSRKRALFVRNYFAERHGIDPARMKWQWFGESSPAYPNDTEENRKKNRRVVIRLEPPNL